MYLASNQRGSQVRREKLPKLHEGEEPFYAGERGSKDSSAKNDLKPEARPHYVEFSREAAAKLSAKLALNSAPIASEEGPDTYLG